MADSSARVQAISTIREFRARLIEFADIARESLGEAEFDIRRTLDWLRHDQKARWQREIKQANKQLEQARSEMFRAEVNAQQTGASARDERQRVKALQHRIEHAERKLQAIDRWLKLIDREMMIYRGKVNALSTAVTDELPAAAEQLKLIASQLDRYVSTSLPTERARPADSGDDVDDQPADNQTSTEQS